MSSSEADHHHQQSQQQQQQQHPSEVHTSDASYWYGKDKRDSPSTWTHQLSPTDLAELDSVIVSISASGKDLSLVTLAEVEPLMPGFASTLSRLLLEVVNGQGFYLLKGIPVWRYSVFESAAAYWAIGLFFGRAVSQNGKGHLLGHVRDLGFDPQNPLTRIYTTSAAQPFH